MSGQQDEPPPYAKSAYARKQKKPTRYSDEYMLWKATGDGRAHDRQFLDPIRQENAKGGRRNGNGNDHA